MPELPDVQVFKEYLDATALHQRIRRTRVGAPRILENTGTRSLQRALKNRRFTSSRRHGKHLFVQCNSDRHLGMHFGMTASLKYYRNPVERPKHVCLELDFTNDYRLAYVCPRKFGKVRLIEGVDAFVEEQDLGIDALDDALDLRRFRELLAGRKGSVKAALMEQSSIAGIGNVYSDEILFQCRLHPATSLDKLDAGHLRVLYRSMRNVLQTAIRCKVERDYFPGHYLIRHRVSDRRCPRCGNPIRKARVAGRSAQFCSACQKKS